MSNLRHSPKSFLVLGWVLATFVSAVAQESRGFKFNNLSVSPFVNLEYAYDSNVRYNSDEDSDSILRINPGVDFVYKGNEWGLTGNAWYNRDIYFDLNELDADRYGERVGFWKETASGWRLQVDQAYLKSSQDDSMADGGKGVWRDRDQLDLSAALSYMLSEKNTVSLRQSYSDLQYNNDQQKYGALYGWKNWTTDLEWAHKLTEKSDVLVNGSYFGYESAGAAGIDNKSTGYSLMVGFGSRATKKVSYRVLAGYNRMEYAGGLEKLDGWTYSLNMGWAINDKWALTLVGSSFFQPSETAQNQAQQVYTLSSGVAYRPTTRLTTHLDLAARRLSAEYSYDTAKEDSRDLYSIRARADYQLSRYVSVYAGFEFQTQSSDESYNDYDRFRGSLGVKLRY